LVQQASPWISSTDSSAFSAWILHARNSSKKWPLPCLNRMVLEKVANTKLIQALYNHHTIAEHTKITNQNMDCSITFKASTKHVMHMQGNKNTCNWRYNTNLALSELLPSSCFLLLGQIYRRVAAGKKKISPVCISSILQKSNQNRPF